MKTSFESRIIKRTRSKDGKLQTFALKIPSEIVDDWINKKFWVTLEEI